MCEYCENGKLIIDVDGDGFDGGVAKVVGAEMFVNWGDRLERKGPMFVFEINACPMCGRRFEEGVPSCRGQESGDAGFEIDSREELEADISKYIACNLHGRKVMLDECALLYDNALDWLYRQAAITERELGHVRENWAQQVDEQSSEIAELLDRVDELESLVRQLDGDLRGARKSRDHWRRVASRHAAEIQRLNALAEDGEKYGAIWPRWEDGQPIVPPCEIVYEGRVERIQGIRFYDTSTVFEFTGVDHCVESVGYPHGCTFERPAPLAADGEPIDFGQVLYGGDGKSWEVEGFDYEAAPYIVKGVHREVGEGKFVKQLKPEWLRHGKPDSLSELMSDVKRGVVLYPRERVSGYLEDNHSLGDAVMLDVRDRLNGLFPWHVGDLDG